MKQKLIKKLHDLMLQIITCNDAELDKIGIELAEIEKQLINWQEKKSQKKIKKYLTFKSEFDIIYM